MLGLAGDEKRHKVACRANLWYNIGMKNVFASALVEQSEADNEKGTLAMSSSIPRQKKSDLERFLSCVSVQENGCWLWTGSKSKDGYGRFSYDHGTWGGAHRWSYEYFVGPVLPNQDVDHLCRNRACVHPEHLEPVSHRENCRRGARGALKDNKTSQYLGVYWVKKRNKWCAQIQLNGEMYYLGYFDDEVLAHQVYTQAYNAYIKDGTFPARPEVRKASRYPGVSWNTRSQKWIVQTYIDGKQRYIGRFLDEETAYQAYLKAIEK